MVEIVLTNGESIEWGGLVTFLEGPRVFLLVESGTHHSKSPKAIYPAENVAKVEGMSGSFVRQQNQPKGIEIRGPSELESDTEEG